MALILYGKEVAAALIERSRDESDRLCQIGCPPKLTIVRAGDDAADAAYERGIYRACERAGVIVSTHCTPFGASQRELTETLRSLSADRAVHGILLMRPLPRGFDERISRDAIAPEKDVDGVTDRSLSGVFTGSGEGFAPCTAMACVQLLEHYGIKIAGKNVVVIGRSLVVGRPVSMLLLARDATVTVCHTKTANIAEICSSADIIIAAAGREGLIGRNCMSSGQTIVDCGINVNCGGKLCGDVDFEAASEIALAASPVPGGVGTVTAAVLASHVVEAAQRLCGVAVL
ncbi:MAG: tetrahydrofolate dehydrogenase/cyclohydrolase catalytic domain-containing protein [Oscillospiraceae bacterium]